MPAQCSFPSFFHSYRPSFFFSAITCPNKRLQFPSCLVSGWSSTTKFSPMTYKWKCYTELQKGPSRRPALLGLGSSLFPFPASLSCLLEHGCDDRSSSSCAAYLSIETIFKWWKNSWWQESPTQSGVFVCLLAFGFLQERRQLSGLSHCYLGLPVESRRTWPCLIQLLLFFSFSFFPRMNSLHWRIWIFIPRVHSTQDDILRFNTMSTP